MKWDKKDVGALSGPKEAQATVGKAGSILESNIGLSIDRLVEYLVDNNVEGIHPFIMGEVEKRLIVKVLERSRGNKLQAAKLLGMGRNTFHRKMQKLFATLNPGSRDVES
jgi:Fis family transcriptional regulator, factor for inversion stimulation protein